MVTQGRYPGPDQVHRTTDRRSPNRPQSMQMTVWCTCWTAMT